MVFDLPLMATHSAGMAGPTGCPANNLCDVSGAVRTPQALGTLELDADGIASAAFRACAAAVLRPERALVQLEAGRVWGVIWGRTGFWHRGLVDEAQS